MSDGEDFGKISVCSGLAGNSGRCDSILKISGKHFGTDMEYIQRCVNLAVDSFVRY